jgi:hypothetical protein
LEVNAAGTPSAQRHTAQKENLEWKNWKDNSALSMNIDIPDIREG